MKHPRKGDYLSVDLRKVRSEYILLLVSLVSGIALYLRYDNKGLHNWLNSESRITAFYGSITLVTLINSMIGLPQLISYFRQTELERDEILPYIGLCIAALISLILCSFCAMMTYVGLTPNPFMEPL